MTLYVRYEGIESDECFVFLSGALDEDAWNELNQLNSLSQKKVTISLKDLDYINSLGVRNWISFLKLFGEGRAINFKECPSYFIKQLNMIPRLIGDAEIESFYGDFYCSNCDEEKNLLFNAGEGFEHLIQKFDEMKCDVCKDTLEFEEDHSSYFEFLKRRSKIL